jgi:hypothetical protein
MAGGAIRNDIFYTTAVAEAKRGRERAPSNNYGVNDITALCCYPAK